MRTTRWGVVALGILLAAPCWAETPAAARASAVQVGGGFALPFGDSSAEGNPGWLDLELSAGRQIARRLDLEVGLAWAPAGSRLVRTAAGTGEETFETGVGALTRALVRLWLLEGTWRPVLAAGPALAFGGQFGTVPLAQLEGGIELRHPTGLCLLAALRGYVPLSRSRTDIESGRCLTSDCPSRLHPGLILGSRVAAGFAF